MIAGHLRRLCSALILVFTIVAASLCASGATPFTGFYMGTMYVSISGNITMPERAAGPAGINIHEEGTVTSSGDLAGTVDSAGNITWVLPNIAEYVFGSSATDGDAGEKPKGISSVIQNESYAAVQFTRGTTATGASIRVQASRAVDFSALENVVETVEPIGNGIERVTVRASQPATTTFFFRISITLSN